MTTDWRARVGVATCALAMQACGSGLPLLHPAQPLPSGATSMSAGQGSHWVGGQARRELSAAELQMASAQGGYYEIPPAAALAAALWSPGLFPWLSMRAGLGSQSEAGVAYTGRRARLDARRAISFRRWALSIGVGAAMGLAHPSTFSSGSTTTLGTTESLPGFDTTGARSIGVDAPLVIGWHSSADIARIWIGIRPSYEHGYGELALNAGSTSTQFDYRSDVFSVSGLAGLAMGLRPLFVALELGLGDSRGHGRIIANSGTAIGGSASISAYSFTPAASLIWELR